MIFEDGRMVEDKSAKVRFVTKLEKSGRNEMLLNPELIEKAFNEANLTLEKMVEKHSTK